MAKKFYQVTPATELVAFGLEGARWVSFTPGIEREELRYNTSTPTERVTTVIAGKERSKMWQSSARLVVKPTGEPAPGEETIRVRKGRCVVAFQVKDASVEFLVLSAGSETRIRNGVTHSTRPDPECVVEGSFMLADIEGTERMEDDGFHALLPDDFE